jgi:predicted aspartyl protease
MYLLQHLWIAYEEPMPVKPTPPVLTQFTRERSTHITVVCTLSGQDARFLVDTGAGGTCIDANALEAYGLSLKGKSQNGAVLELHPCR